MRKVLIVVLCPFNIVISVVKIIPEYESGRPEYLVEIEPRCCRAPEEAAAKKIPLRKAKSNIGRCTKRGTHTAVNLIPKACACPDGKGTLLKVITGSIDLYTFEIGTDLQRQSEDKLFGPDEGEIIIKQRANIHIRVIVNSGEGAAKPGADIKSRIFKPYPENAAIKCGPVTDRHIGTGKIKVGKLNTQTDGAV